jgi:hypothetical protein
VRGFERGPFAFIKLEVVELLLKCVDYTPLSDSAVAIHPCHDEDGDDGDDGDDDDTDEESNRASSDNNNDNDDVAAEQTSGDLAAAAAVAMYAAIGKFTADVARVRAKECEEKRVRREREARMNSTHHHYHRGTTYNN